MARHRTAPSDINAAERAKLALMLRKQGYTLDEIARQVGYTHKSAACKAVKRELKQVPRSDAQELQTLEELRLDDLLKACMPKAQGGDLWAIDRVIAISKRRSEVTGMDVKADEAQVNTNYTKRIILDIGGANDAST